MANAGLAVRVRTPYVNINKKDVVFIGKRLRVPLAETWSCYLGGGEPCGRCDACAKREEAMR